MPLPAPVPNLPDPTEVTPRIPGRPARHPLSDRSRTAIVRFERPLNSEEVRMVGRAIAYGVGTGAALGILVMLGFLVGDTTDYRLVDLVAVAVVYLPLSLGVGALAGLVEALVAVGALLALRQLVAAHTWRA